MSNINFYNGRVVNVDKTSYSSGYDQMIIKNLIKIIIVMLLIIYSNLQI